MPIHKTLHLNNSTSIYVWKIEEEFNSLFRSIPLKDTSLARLESMKDVKHQNGFLSIRHLLKAAGYDDFDLFYDEKGKPHLKDGKEISITHSFDFSAIIISDKKVGIDIELRRDKVQLIAKKFVDIEFNYIQKEDKQYTNLLTVVWGAKESIYKLYNQKGLFFIENIIVHPFKMIDDKGTAEVNYKNRKSLYNFAFEEIENYTLVYALEQVENA
ncbi:4'-phosphopantetheinyl transferase superfamily protein [uncultured Flavobacterium sp.]|uniref:4'-phosphopantetheinyl transferase family protein n=1 Tax=uncultured Flavobacterium sp. TaxID=165435 RepID=UPI0030C7FBD0